MAKQNVENDILNPSSTFINAIVLKDYFDPNVLLKQPGIYIAYSDTNAYPILWAMQEIGLVKQIGEHYPAPGKKAITVKIAGTRHYKLNPAQEEEIKLKVGARFLTNAISAYRNWPEIWWREVIQNSVDAGATKIELGCIKQPDGTWKVWCDDNGKGMSKDILINKFFALGETGKEDVDEYGRPSIGGFGKAKEVLILPWIDFSIHTRNVLAKSKPLATRTAESFASLQETTPRQGTRLEVIMPGDKHTNPRLAVQLLNKCYLPNILITVEGALDQYDEQTIKRYSVEANLKAGKAIGFFPSEENPIAKLHFKKPDTTKKYVMDKISKETMLEFRRQNPNSYSIIVRSGGVKMFEIPLPYSVQGMGTFIIDLVPRRDIKPRDVFTDNRDGFKDDRINQAIANYISQLERERERALIEQSKIFTQVFEGIGAFSPHKMQEKSKYRAGIARSTIKTKSVKDQVGNTKVIVEDKSVEEAAEEIDKEIERERKDYPVPPEERTKDIITNPSGGVFRAMFDMTDKRGEEQIEVITKQAVWKPHFMLHNEMEDVEVKSKYYPEHMSPNIVKLAKYWTDLCRWVLGQLGCDFEFGVGFVFSETAAAMHVYDTKQIVKNWLLINPVNIIRKGGSNEPWRLSDEEHIRYLYACAIHEATHMVDDIHDHMTAFASAITVNMAICADLNKAKRFLSYVKITEAAEKGEDRPKHEVSPGTSTRAELEQETGIFKPDAPMGRGRPKKIYEIGTKDNFQIRYMWSNAVTDGPRSGTQAKIEVWSANDLIYSKEVYLIDTLKELSQAWSSIAYNYPIQRLDIMPSLIVASPEKEHDVYYIQNQITESDLFVNRTYVALALQSLADKITERLNFMTATYDEAKYANKEWKHVRGLPIV